MEKRKAFEDTRKWWIWRTPAKNWTVTPPIGYDHEEYEKTVPFFVDAVEYWVEAYKTAEPMDS